MSISDKLQRIRDIKGNIKNAITEKGVEVNDSDSFNSYADKIKSIPQEGGSGNANDTRLVNLATSNMTNFEFLFYNKDIQAGTDLSWIDTSNVTNMQNTFNNCPFESLDISSWNMDNVQYAQYMFYNCSNVKEVKFPERLPSLISTENMFNSVYSNYDSLDVSTLDMSNVQYAQYMFANNYFSSINTDGWNTSSLYNIDGMFQYSYSLTSLDLNHFDTSNVHDAYAVFQCCSNLKTININEWNMDKVNNVSYMFQSCNNLTSLDLSKWSLKPVNDMSYMFSECYNLKNIDLRSVDTRNRSVNADSMFSGVTDATITVSEGLWTLDTNSDSYGGSNLTFNIIPYDITSIEVTADVEDPSNLNTSIINYTLSIEPAHGIMDLEIIYDSTYMTVKNGKIVLKDGAQGQNLSVTFRSKRNNDINQVIELTLSPDYVFPQFDGTVDFTNQLPVFPVWMNEYSSGDYTFELGSFSDGVDGLVSDNTYIDNSVAYKVYEITPDSSYTMKINYRCQSENGSDYLMVHLRDSMDGFDMWDDYNYQLFSTQNNDYYDYDTSYTTTLNEGNTYYLVFRYRKDGSSSQGVDKACIRSIELKEQYNLRVNMYDSNGYSEPYVNIYNSSEEFSRVLYLYGDDDFGVDGIATLPKGTYNIDAYNMGSHCAAINSTITIDKDMEIWIIAGDNTLYTERPEIQEPSRPDYISGFSLSTYGITFTNTDANTIYIQPNELDKTMNFELTSDSSVFDSFYHSFTANETEDIYYITIYPNSTPTTTYSFDVTVKETYSGCEQTFSVNVEAPEYHTEYYTDYTIDTSVATFSMNDTIQDGAYLPQLSNGYTYIELTLNDRTETTDLTTEASLVSTIRIYYPEETSYIKFANTKVKEVTHLNGTNITDCTGMFTNCIYLQSADLSTLDSTKVVVDETMFEGVDGKCEVIFNESWDIPNEDMGKEEPANPYFVEYTIDVADDCTDPVNTQSDYFKMYIPTFGYGFYDDKLVYKFTLKDGTTTDNLETAVNNIDRIRIEYVENIHNISFSGTKIKELLNINISKFSSFENMFYNCGSLTAINGIENWDTTNIVNMTSMFDCCSSITTLDLSNWNTSSLQRMASMFASCSSLTTLNVSNWNTSNVTSIKRLFANSKKLTTVQGIEDWNTENVTNMEETFREAEKLTNINISNWNTKNVTNMYCTFYSCPSLTSLDLSGWDTSSVTNMYGVFSMCSKLETLVLSSWNTEKVTSMSAMFAGCKNLKTLDLSNFNTANVSEMSNMLGYSWQPVPSTVDWCYDGTNYTNWTLTEEQTGFTGTFPWNQSEE